MTQLIFVRHGQTSSNVERRWQGWTDTPLNELGEKQAQLVAKRLSESHGKIQALYSSPLSRAYQTAKAIAEGLDLPVRLVEGLKEFHFGEIEGMTTEEVQATYPELLKRWEDRHDMTFAYPNGESREAFTQRIANTLGLIALRHPDDTVVVVSHGGALRAALSHYFPEDGDHWAAFVAGNCSLTVIQLNGHAPRLISVDDQEHLHELEAVFA